MENNAGNKIIDKKMFFQYVIPSILSFALSGVYAIVDGFFVGNSIGDAGLSAINIAYPIQAVLQSVGTGIGMGAAVKYSISAAEGKTKEARSYIACAMWLMTISSVLLAAAVYTASEGILDALGASGELLELGSEYIRIVALGAALQVFGTGLVPLMRNYGGAFWAMISMVSGFGTNIILDYAFVWVMGKGMTGAALATVIGQGVTAGAAFAYCLVKKKVTFSISAAGMLMASLQTFKIGLAPFGLTLVPNISLVIINKFSTFYGGEEAIATYACISYIICIIYLVLQGVGDGSQPLMSSCYGMGDDASLKRVKMLAYEFAMILAAAGVTLLYVFRGKIGLLFGSSAAVNEGIITIMPIFLVSVPFVAVTRIATAAFYATEKSVLSYILTFIEPVLMLILMAVLPPLLGGQVMIWWSTVFARILTAALAVILTVRKNSCIKR